MLKQIIKNKKVWYAMAGLATVLSIFVFTYFSAQATKPATPSSLQQYVSGTSTAVTNGNWITANNIYLTATSTDASNNPFVMYYQLVDNGTSFTTSTTSPTSFCDQRTLYNDCTGKIWANATNTPDWVKGYKYRTPITVLASRVTGALVDFPVYLDLARLGTTNVFWSHTNKNSNGGDLLMTTSNGTTRIPIEVVVISTSTKTGEVYFKASSISSSSNITFYLYYGSSTAAQPASSTATYGSQNVWNSGYKGVFHYGASALNSTANGGKPITNTSITNTTISAVGNSSAGFTVAGTNAITYSATGPLNIYGNTPLTVETWIRYTALSTTRQQYFCKGNDTQYAFQKTNANPGVNRFFVYDGGWQYSESNASIAVNTWYSTVGTYEGTNGGAVNFFQDGVQQTMTDTATTITQQAAIAASAGGYTARFTDGYVDEVRVSNVRRSNKWISTTYNNEKNPSTFFSTSTTEDYYLTINKKPINIPSVPESSTGYKWQALACDNNAMCSPWQTFNDTTPNFKVDTIKPTTPAAFTLSKKNNTSITLRFGATSTDANFFQYKIFYKIGASGVAETDSLFGSSTTPGDTVLQYGNLSKHSTTTVTGLFSGTTYVFKIWAYDQAGQKASSSEYSTATKNFPAIASGLSQYKADSVTTIDNGAWTIQNEVYFTATSTDADSDAITLYYQLATSSGPFLSATTTPTNACSSGTAWASCPSRVWQTPASTKKVDLKSLPDQIDPAGYKWQVLACDGDGCSRNWKVFNASVPNFKLDANSPTAPNPSTRVSSSTTAIKLGLPAAATEINFREYKIYYRLGSTTQIHENDSLISSSTAGYSYLGSQTFSNKSSTTIFNLATGTVYSFSLWAYDLAGNKSSSSLVWDRTDRLPNTAIFNSAAERTDGMGRVDLSFDIDDLDKETQIMAKVEYVAGTSCNQGVMSKATLDETPANVSASYGTPVVQNKNAYQVGTSTGWISSVSGVNTINVDWLSKTDLPSADGVYCLKITVNDNRGGYKIATTTMYLDNVAPTAPGSLTFSKRGNYKINPYLNATSTETNFFEYKIFYKIGFSGVTEEDSEFSSSTIPGDSALGDKNYLDHATTSVTGLIPGTQYAFNIWAYDVYGNKASGTAEFTYNTTGPPNVFDHTQYGVDGLTVIANGDWTNDGEVNFYATSTNDEAGTPDIYYQLATTSGAFITATGTPDNACSSGTAWASCPSRVWYSSKLVKANIKNIPTNDYKWQALACNGDGCSKKWVVFDASTPNFRMDVIVPSSLSNLTLSKRNNTSVYINLGSAVTETYFRQYKIFYKIGASGVSQADSLFGSSTTPGDAALASQTFLSRATTTVTGLYSGTQYVFNIWAYDLAGNYASATSEFTQTTKSFPSIPNTLSQYRADGISTISNDSWIAVNEINLYATSTDADNDTRYIYYQLATTSGTFLTATTTPANACVSGTVWASCPSRVWYSAAGADKKADIKNIPDGNYKWQAITCDGDGCSRAWAAFNGATPNLKIDVTAPSAPNPFSMIASTTTSIKFNLPAAVTETNFRQYKIYYRLGSTTAIHETDSLISSSTADYSYLGFQNLQSKSSTTISGLATGTVYSFSLWAYDQAGNKSSSSLVWERTDRSPNILSFNSASERTDGTGRVDISLTLNDLDWDTQMKAKVEYVLGVSCEQGVLNKATLDEADDNTSADYGDPKVQNKNAYQIGTSTGYIISSSTANALNFDWFSQTDLPVGDGTYCLRVTLDDNRGGSKVATALLTIDNNAPTAPGNLTFSKKNYSKITLFFGAASTETNFSQYNIFYKEGVSGVTEVDRLFGPTLDSALYSRTYLSHATTTITNLLPSTDYVFNIWAYDLYGNKTYAAAEYSTSTNILPGYFPYNLVQYRLSTSSLMFNGGWTNDGTVNLYSTSTNGDGSSNTIYYELIDDSGSFTTATSEPAYFCQSGTSFAGCTSKLWVSAPPVSGWYDPDFRWRAKITVQSAGVTANQTNFPVYVNLGDFSSAHSLWEHTKKNSDGGDLIITNSAGTRLPLEIVSISTSSETGEIYFRADSLSSSANTDFYLYYGSSTASQPAATTTYGSRAVWSNEFVSVWHFQQTSGSLTDSVSGLAGTFNGDLPDARATSFGNSHHFDGTGDYIQTNSTELNSTNIANFTWSVWFDADSTVSSMLIWEGDVSQNGWGTGQEAHLGFGYTTTANYLGMYFGDTEANSIITYNAFTNTTSWHQAVGTFSNLNTAPAGIFYLDGASVASDSGTAVTRGWDTAMRFGRPGTSERYFNGFMDEVRISSTTRSSTWISTEYNNQNSSATFYGVADEESYFALNNKAVKITSLPDSGYKWQAIACNVDGACSPWTKFDLATPNFNVDTVAPTGVSSLTPLASTTDSIKLQFGAAATETNFYQYKIYYKIGSTTAIHETDSLFGSTTDANLLSRTFNGKSSTTISGLATNTVYSFSLWAYDLAGNKSSSSLTWERTDRLPDVSIISALQRVDGTGRVDISLAVDDPDRDNQIMAKIDYVQGTDCIFGTLDKATLDETDANTTATDGDPKVQNKNTYQIGTSTGWITASAGANTVDFDWLSKTDIPAGDSTYCLRATVNDNRGGVKVSTITLTIDNVAPVGFGALTLNKKALTYITPNFGAAATESHFRQYKIFYKVGTSGVRESDTLFGSSTTPGDAALASQTYLTHATTSITGLIADTNYVFNLWAYDTYGNKASTTSEFTTKTKARPTGVFNSSGLQVNGSGRVDISINVDDNDDDNTLSAKLEYFASANCTGSPLDPTLDQNQATITAASGTPIILNSSAYQIGNSGGYIPTSDGANTVNFNWLSKTDIPDVEATYCLRLTANDGGYDQAVLATTSLYIDNKAPTGLGSLTLNKKVQYTASLNFGAAAVETAFDRYRIFYRQGDNTVAETDNEKIDGNLNSQNYGLAATTSISSLETGYWYATNIWAYDDFGNKASATPVNFKINKKPNEQTSLLQVEGSGAVILNGGLSDQSAVNLKAYVIDTDSTSTTFYFELLANASSFTTATTVPSSICSSGDAFGACGSKIWAAATSSAPSDWYNSAWAYRKKITINHAQVTGALSGFPILVSLTSDADLAARARSDGHDIVFTSANGRTPLKFEKEDYVGLTGRASFWVKTDVSAAADTYIYVYYGNSGQTSDLSSTGVWDASAQAVWHLAEAGTSDRTDSTALANDAATNNYDGTEKTQTGKIANADYLNGFNKFLRAPDANSLDITNNITVSGWVNPSSFISMIPLETGGYPRYQFVGLKWAATGGTDCAPDGAFDPKMINPYTGALYGNSSWTPGSSWNFYDTSLTSVYYGATQYSVDLNKVWGNVSANSEAYIGAYIYSPDNRAVDISRGSDDGSQLWVNGHFISNDCNAHSLAVDAITAAVNLKQGWNTIIMRVANGASDWAGVWRVSSNANGLLTIAGSRILVDKQSYQLSLKGKYLSAFYGTTTVDVAIASNSWQYFTLSGDSANVEILVNGASQGSASFSSAPTANTQPIQLGNNYSGILDEVRVESAKRSAAWLSTSYNNQNNPAAFASFGLEQSRTGMGNTVSIISIPDSASGYKWQVMACDEENACSNWTGYNSETPNFKTDADAPIAPGSLTFSKKTGNSLTLAFGSATTDQFFSEYKIFYKQGSSGVKESDSLFGSSSDAHLSAINYGGVATTTISGLANNTQYVFNIWAYDTSGRKASATVEYAGYTNAAPTASFVSALERADASGRIDISILANDANLDPLKAKLEYAPGTTCNFSTPLDPTLDETDYTATSTYGDAKISNSNAYQIGNDSGWIITTSGANTVNFDWLTPLDLPAANNTYCLRLTANDGTENQLALATTTLTLDNLKPTAPGALSIYKREAGSLVLGFGAPTVETNFQSYKIFYKQGTGVTENDTQLTDSNLGYVNYNGAATTTVTGLTGGKQYSFRIYAYDAYGHKASSTETTYTTDHSPTGVFNSAAQKNNGTGAVDVSVNVNDPDGDSVAAKLEFFANAGCTGSPVIPTLDNNSANISATFGTVDINNSNAYQVGDVSRIITSSGVNTINFDWLSMTDIPAGDGSYCLRLTVNDGQSDQASAATTSLIIDNAAPAALGNLSISRANGNSVFLSFGTPATDSNFKEYKIFYKAGTAVVTESDSAFTKLQDANLGFINFRGKATTSVATLNASTEYSFNIWVYDQYGNKSQAAAQVTGTTIALAGATWREAEDTVDPTGILYLGKEKAVRVRIAVANTGDWEATSNKYKVQYSSKAATCAAVSSWFDVPTTTSANDFAMTESGYFYNGEPTIQRFNNLEGYNFTSGSLVKAPSNQTASTTINANSYAELEYNFQATTNATAGRTYCFRVLKDNILLDAYARYPELTLSPPPGSSFVSAQEKVDGSDRIGVALDVSHPAGYPTKVKMEYAANSSCNFASPLDPVLDNAPATVSADYGLPDIDNSEIYQVGSTTGNMVITAYGTNTVAFEWPTQNNFSGVDGTYCLRATAYDGYDNQLALATTTFVIDQIKPTNPGDLTAVFKTATSATLGFGATSSDTHFKEYRIYYKEGTSSDIVSPSDSLWGSSSDANLGHDDFQGATNTVITDLPTNKQYVFRIFAYDIYGHIASSSGQVSVYLWSTKRSSGPWRWYQDQYDETPIVSLGGEKVTPNDVTNNQTIKLRMAFLEVEGIDALKTKVRLQYSTYPDFSTDVNFVGEKYSAATWTYGEGVDNDEDPIISLVLSTTTVKMTHNESGVSTSSAMQPANSWGEWEFTLRNNGAASGTAFYFRGYDTVINQPIPTGGGQAYPNLITSAGSLTINIAGLPSGTITEGVTTNASTTGTSIPFGVLISGDEAIGAQRFTISTNAEWGYSLYAYQTSNLISNNGAIIQPVSSDNSAPAAWPAIFSPSVFGYHTGDDTLSGASPSRFAPDNTYARFEESTKEISFSSIPVVDDTFDFVFRVVVGNLQPAGDFRNNIIYILVPTF